MHKPDAVIDILGLTEWTTCVNCETMVSVKAALENVSLLIGKLEIESTRSASDYDMDSVAALANDLSWYTSEIDTAAELVGEYSDVDVIISERDNELESRLTDDEAHEFEEDMIMYRLKHTE